MTRTTPTLPTSHGATGGALLVLGTGERDTHFPYLAAAARRRPVVLVSGGPLTWECAHLRDHAVADLDNLDALRSAVARLAAVQPIDGVMPLNEGAVVPAAQIAADLGLPGNSVSAATTCRDKAMTRALWAGHGVPSPVSVRVTALVTATTFARRIGYPVALKPAAHTGSGVVKVERRQDLPDAFTRTAHLAGGHGPQTGGVLIEEYVDGPEITVICVTENCSTTAVALARTVATPGPLLQREGHLMVGGDALLTDVGPIAEAALDALDVSYGISSVELRLTGDEPCVIKATMGPDRNLLGLLAQLATGIDLAEAAVDLALGTSPDLKPTLATAAMATRLEAGTTTELPSITRGEHDSRVWLERLTRTDAPRSATAGAVTATCPGRLVMTGADAAECRDRLAIAGNTLATWQAAQPG